MRKLNEETIRKMEGYIREKQRREGRSPSFRNIMHALGMSSLNLVQRYVVALERQGRINRTEVGAHRFAAAVGYGESHHSAAGGGYRLRRAVFRAKRTSKRITHCPSRCSGAENCFYCIRTATV